MIVIAGKGGGSSSEQVLPNHFQLHEQKLCFPTTKEYKVQHFHKDQVRKPRKLEGLPVAFKGRGFLEVLVRVQFHNLHAGSPGQASTLAQKHQGVLP